MVVYYAHPLGILPLFWMAVEIALTLMVAPLSGTILPAPSNGDVWMMNHEG
jgi:hypothetical protein